MSQIRPGRFIRGTEWNHDSKNTSVSVHIDFLKRVLAVVKDGGSALLCSAFGSQAISTARKYPAALFEQLDENWRGYAQGLDAEGVKLSVPPVLGIVLTRCARRDAIPTVIRDLRSEWATRREKVWTLLDRLKTARTLGEALEIQRNLVAASKSFAPEPTEHDSRPVRVLWEVISAAVMGAGVVGLTGGKPVVGAITGAMAQVPRSVPALLHEFGPAVFGRGAFGLARRVRRAVAQVELDALPRLLTKAEIKKLGLK